MADKCFHGTPKGEFCRYCDIIKRQALGDVGIGPAPSKLLHPIKYRRYVRMRQHLIEVAQKALTRMGMEDVLAKPRKDT